MRIVVKAKEEQKKILESVSQYLTFAESQADIDISNIAGDDISELLENEVVKYIWQLVLSAKYEKATTVAFICTMMWPSNPVHSFHWASLYLDSVSFLPNKTKCDSEVRVKKCLLDSLFALQKGSHDYYRCRNEYFFHSRQYKKQLLNGREMAKSFPAGYYASGVGASSILTNRMKMGSLRATWNYAKMAVIDLEKYIAQVHSNYYSAYIHLARAQFFLGSNEYRQTLTKAIALGAPAQEIKALKKCNQKNILFNLISRMMNFNRKKPKEQTTNNKNSTRLKIPIREIAVLPFACLSLIVVFSFLLLLDAVELVIMFLPLLLGLIVSLYFMLETVNMFA